MKILITALFLLLLTGCNTSNNTFGHTDKWIPKDFDPRTSTLLIMDHPWGTKYREKMKKFIEEKYPYPYEIYPVKGPEPTGPQYRFKVVWDKGTTYSPAAGTNIHLIGHFVDLSTDKIYREPSYSNYGYAGYMPFLNSIVKKFK